MVLCVVRHSGFLLVFIRVAALVLMLQRMEGEKIIGLIVWHAGRWSVRCRALAAHAAAHTFILLLKQGGRDVGLHDEKRKNVWWCIFRSYFLFFGGSRAGSHIQAAAKTG